MICSGRRCSCCTVKSVSTAAAAAAAADDATDDAPTLRLTDCQSKIDELALS